MPCIYFVFCPSPHLPSGNHQNGGVGVEGEGEAEADLLLKDLDLIKLIFKNCFIKDIKWGWHLFFKLLVHDGEELQQLSVQFVPVH